MTKPFASFETIPFASLLGIDLTRTEPDGVEAQLLVREELCTNFGTIHGGAIMAFADTLGAIVTMLNLPSDATGTTTIESKTNFMRPAPVGSTVYGESLALHKGRRTHVLQTTIKSSTGKLVAVVTQTQMVLR